MAWANKFLNITWKTITALDWECASCSLPKFNDSFFYQTELRHSNEEDLLDDNVYNAENVSSTSDESDLSPIDWFASNINSYYKRNLKIGHLNVNSIHGKADEVIDLLNTCRFDIFFVAESKIDGSVNSSLFAHSDYRIIRRDRKKGGGGILVYIRRSITLLQPFAEQNSNQMVLNRYV